MRMRTFFVGSILVGSATSAFANLVTNGGFEDPLITSAFVFHAAGSTGINGWTVTGNPGQGVDLVNGSNAGNLAYVHSGVQSVDMAGSPGPGSIVQTLATTANTMYDISFWVSSNGGFFANSLSVEFDGVTLATLNSQPLGTWTQHSFSAMATGASTDIKFNGLFGGNAGALLDDVMVTESVPEPVTLAMALPAALLLRRRRAR